MSLYYKLHLANEVVSKDLSDRRPVIVLLHGGALSGRMFRTLVPELKTKGYDAILCPDLPGHGDSKSLGPFTFTRSTELLHQLLATLKNDERLKDRKLLLVGVSLGGQAVLDLLSAHPTDVDAAIVCGASVRPPDESAQWEMPHMPSDQGWIDVMMEDVAIMGMDQAQELQNQSFDFTFAPSSDTAIPPTLVCIGRHDVAMAKRDASYLHSILQARNKACELSVLEDAWHNHPVDVPEQFAGLIEYWEKRIFR